MLTHYPNTAAAIPIQLSEPHETGSRVPYCRLTNPRGSSESGLHSAGRAACLEGNCSERPCDRPNCNSFRVKNNKSKNKKKLLEKDLRLDSVNFAPLVFLQVCFQGEVSKHLTILSRSDDKMLLHSPAR